MMGTKDLTAPVRRISPKDGRHYFYGYYDNNAFSADGTRHLCHRVRFMDRLPEADDPSDIGVLDLSTGDFTALDETRAWNFQQGCMLEWNPANPDEVLYNVWHAGEYRCTALNTSTGVRRIIGPALADVSPDGRYGLALNFARIYDFRPGYGYCQLRDPWFDTAMPADDGVTLVDMRTGSCRLLFSYRQLGNLFNTSPDLQKRKIVINHITFNRTSNRFLFLLRIFPQPGKSWGTALGTSDLAGNIEKLSDYTYASHYCWKDGTRLLIHADFGKGRWLYELTDLSRETIVLDRAFFTSDIHCSYSPDGRYILGDGYPDEEGYRTLMLYNILEQRGLLLGKVYSPVPAVTDIRCDLHARWNCTGTCVSFDSFHEGFRGIYLMDVSELVGSNI